MRKTILSLLLCICMILTMLPAAAAEGETAKREVFFVNSDNWSTVYAYTWTDQTEHLGTWPGSVMTKVEGQTNLYSIYVPADAVNIIFNNGSGTQTADLTLPTKNNCFTYNGGWSYVDTCEHSYEAVVTTAPTCTADGVKTYTCGICAYQYTETISATGHSYVDGKCDICGAVEPKNRVIFFVNSDSWSTVYAYTWTDQTEHLGTWPGSVMTKAEGQTSLYNITVPPDAVNIIFNNGSGIQTADLTLPDEDNCYTYNGGWSYVETCDHTYEAVVTTAPTCTNAGIKTFTCTKCGKSKTEEIATLPHSFSDGKCTECGAYEECDVHTWDDGQVITEKTCWTPGSVKYTCIYCRISETRTVSGGHDFYYVVTLEPTCTAMGKQATKCYNCAYIADKYLPKIDHSYVAGEVVAPTCTTDGYTVHTCIACGGTASLNPVDMLGHSWNGNTCATCGTTCHHTLVDGICYNCGKGGPVYKNGYYEIANDAQLKWFAAQVNGGNNAINGKLLADIDLNNSTWTSIGYYCKNGDANNSVGYTGIFDGQGYEISNFITAGTDNEGLFGYTSSATIKNLGIVNAKVTGWRAGAVVGYGLTSTIENCYAVGCTITGSTSNAIALQSGAVYIAPITSPQSGTVRNCYAVNCILVDDTDLSIETAPVGGLIRSNQFYCNVSYASDFYWTTGATEVTAAEMASGEVAYKLGEAWGQKIGIDSFPVLFGDKVYFENDTYFNFKYAISQKGRTLSYEDLIYVIDIFELIGIEGIDLTKDAGLLIWSVEEFEALSEITFDADHAKIGLSPYKETGYYSGSSDGIFTRDLHEEAYYVGYVKLADGSYIYSEPKLYSPAIYAYNMLDKDTTSDATKDLCVALLNYISTAQVYFHGTPEEELVNYELSDEQKALDWDNVALNLASEVPADKQVERDKAVFTGTGKNLLFEEMISIVSIFKIDDEIVNNADDCGTIYWTAEQFTALEGAPSIDNIGDGTKVALSQYKGNAGQWCSHAPEVAAKDMADTQYYYLGYVIHADGTVSYSGVISYTVEQYISNMVNGEDSSDTMLAFAQRLYYYERAAEAALKKA